MAWAALGRLLAAERPRWPLWLPVAFAAGVGVYFALPSEPPVWLGGAAFALVAVLAWGLRRLSLPLICCLVAACMAAGFAAAQLRSAAVAAPLIEKTLKGRSVTGEVVALEPWGRGHRLLLQDLEISGLAPAETPARVRLSLAGKLDAEVRPGDRVMLRAELSPPPGPVAPGAFDFGRRAYFQRIGGFGFAFGAPTPVAGAAAQGGFAPWLADLRQSIAARVQAALPGDRGAIAAALMVGLRGAISEPTLEAMRDAGLAHLLAISGLHMGLAAGWLFLLVRGLLALVPRIALYYPIKKWAAAVACIGALLYLGLAGAPIPTIRAFIMVATVLAAVLLDRRALSLRLVAWAAFLVLLILPESLISVSFQLSFAAVVALIAAYERLSFRGWSWAAEAGWLGRIGLYVGSVAFTSLIAGLATAPFAAYHFNRLVVYGVLANLLAVPLTAFWIMPWALAAFLLMPFGLERLALLPMGWGIDGLLWVATEVAAWPGAFLAIKAMPLAALLGFTFGGLWLAIWQRPWRLLGLTGIALGFLLTAFSRPPDVWVNDDGALFGIRGSDGRLHLSSRRVGRFDAEIWQRRAALEGQASFPKDGAALDGRLRCDALGCLYSHQGRLVALATDSRALWEDCAVADAVVSREPVRRRDCPEPAVLVDRFDLWREGATTLTFGAHKIEVRTARAERGERPWVLQHGTIYRDASDAETAD